MLDTLRGCQREGLQAYKAAIEGGRKSLLWEMCPGAGKTRGALVATLHQFQQYGRKRAVFVVPTRHLCHQWARAAAGVVLRVDGGFKTGSKWPSRADGIAVTYAQLASDPSYFTDLARGAFVVIDEVHHTADGKKWGEALRTAFDDPGLVLALSGTPFRSDNNPIPFVTYQDNESVPDYQYSYERAILDGICRPVLFFHHGADVTWGSDDNTAVTLSLSDIDCKEDIAAKKLRAALDPTGDLIVQMLTEANATLNQLRKADPVAGGLVVAMDQSHARAIASVLKAITGKTAAVALSDDEFASAHIDKFANGRDAWLVTCRMVSEGVDIPRLRVGVYATTTTTRMFFRQFLGRIVRKYKGVDNLAYCYLPADPRLQLLAAEVESLQNHSIRGDSFNKENGRKENQTGEDTEQPGRVFINGVGVEMVIGRGRQLPLLTGPLYDPDVIEAAYLEAMNNTAGGEQPVNLSQLTNEVNRLTRSYCHKRKRAYHEIYGMLNSWQGVRFQGECTAVQLQARLIVLQKWIQEV